jgi:hypothetical protein
LHALGTICHILSLGPPRRRQTSAEVDDGRFGHVNAERADGIFRSVGEQACGERADGAGNGCNGENTSTGG